MPIHREQLQPKPKPPPALRQTKAPAARITVPFEYFRRHIYVTVTLQGKPGFIFMLDSGANRNILNLRTSKLLGMQPMKLQQEKNIGFGDAPVYVAPEERIDATIGSIQVAQEMAVIDLNRFEHALRPSDRRHVGVSISSQLCGKGGFPEKTADTVSA